MLQLTHLFIQKNYQQINRFNIRLRFKFFVLRHFYPINVLFFQFRLSIYVSIIIFTQLYLYNKLKSHMIQRMFGPIRLFLSRPSLQFFSQSKLQLNKYFEQQLKAQKFIPLKDFQLQTFKIISSEGQNCFINSCTGSGKTLAYLLPIINKILNDKQKILKAQSLAHESSIEYEQNQKHGALIFTLNKELCLQVYREIRLLDPQNKLNVFRVGPISHFAPVVQLLNKKQKTPDQQDEIAESVQRNIVKCVNWAKTDILIATPQMFYNIMTQIIHNKSNLINPQFLAIDEADLLLEIDQNVAKYMQKIIDLLRKDKSAVKGAKDQIFVQQKDGDDQNTSIRYLMSSSSFPKKIKKIPTEQFLQKNFKPIKSITGVNKHRLPERLDMKYIEIQAKASIIPNSQNIQVDKEKLYYVEKILSDPEKKGNRFIIFCNNRKTVEKVSAFISQKLKLESIQYYAGLPSDQRSINLHKFMNESFDILVSTDLGSRGLDFTKPIHTVIEYDLAENIVNFINRAGRTARNELPGQIISFVEEKNKIFFEQLAQKNSQDEQFDGLFSRKRSYNKLVLKYLKQQKNQSQ